MVGFGCAGYHAVKAMREAGYTGAIHVFTDGTDAPANPMLTTYYVAGRIPFDALTPFGPLGEIAAKFDLTVHSGQRVTTVDYGKKQVLCDDGSAWSYDKLLIATGASALVPGFAGSELPGVYTMRTVQDALQLREQLEKGDVRQAVVVGASMVGIKVVELLSEHGVKTTLADLATQIFPLATLPDTAALIEERVREKGVELLFGQGISAITGEGRLTAHFGEGTTRPCDLVVLCIGTRANTALAGDALEVRRGIVVDCQMQTSLADVYAAGDCCEGRNLQSNDTQIIGLWANAAMQGETAGKNIAGKPARHEGNITHNITHFFDMDFISFGDNRKTGQLMRFASPDGTIHIQAVMDDGRMACLNILDCYAVSGILKSYFIKRLLGCDVTMGSSERVRLGQREIPQWFIQQLEQISMDSEAPEFCETR